MAFSTIPNISQPKLQPPRLTCPAKLWRQILSELRTRGRGEIESGGFLLGVRKEGQRSVTQFLAYDDVDPNALQGMIMFDGSKMDVVWNHCRKHQLEVVADVHTHPWGYGQSPTDQANPMIPEKGHIALIVPNFADHDYFPGKIGIYEFCGFKEDWKVHSKAGAVFFAVIDA